MEIHTRDYPDLIKNFPQLQTHRQKVASIPNVKTYLENRPVTLFWEFCPYACIQYFVDTWKDFTFWFGSVKLVHLSDVKQCSNRLRYFENIIIKALHRHEIYTYMYLPLWFWALMFSNIHGIVKRDQLCCPILTYNLHVYSAIYCFMISIIYMLRLRSCIFMVLYFIKFK